MASIKPCPRCGTTLNIAGDKFICPSCRVSLVRKAKGDAAASSIQETPSAPQPLSAPVLDFNAQAPAPRTSKRGTLPAVRNGVLAGAALFLLLGTVMTGYAFALTFSSPPENAKLPETVAEAPKPPAVPPAPEVDWRVTLSNLRPLVVTPPTALTQAPKEEKPTGPPPRVNGIIDKGVVWLKGAALGKPGYVTGHGGTGGLALAGLTLLECGVSADDDSLKRVIQRVRASAPHLMQTYEVATCIWFLDRLNREEDKPLIRKLALRLIFSQGPMAGWDYQCHLLSDADETHLMKLLSENPLGESWRKEMNAALLPPSPNAPAVRPFVGRLPRPASIASVPLFLWEPGKQFEMKTAGHEDNSLTQFAVLALWAARKHGVPVERSLAFVEARFRNYQNADGSWGYVLRQAYRRDSMTCAGLLGLAVGRGLGKQNGPAAEVKDEAIEKALVYLGQIVSRGNANLNQQELAKKQAEAQELMRKMRQTTDPKEQRKIQAELVKLQPFLRSFGTRGKLVGADGWGDLYFLWSMERMAVVYDLKTIAGKDWHAWGSEVIMNAQMPDGSWKEAFPGIPDTCFALLFLKRVNVVKDLTEQLKLLGKVKDPGNVAPSIQLPGEQGKPDEK